MKTERPSSPLPRDPEYWNDLAGRVIDDARAPLAEYALRHGARGDGESVYDVLARGAPWLAAASLAAAGWVWIAGPSPSRADIGRPSSTEQVVAPDEEAGALLGSSTPPSVGELMLLFPPGVHGEDESETAR